MADHGRPQEFFTDPETNAKEGEIFGRFKATWETMADYYGCSIKTIERELKKEDSAFCRAYKKSYSDLKMKLSEKQIHVALEEKSVPMLIWLGKQHLGQKDKQEVDNTSKGEQIQFYIPANARD